MDDKMKITQKMLERALLSCVVDEPADHYPCEDCYLYPLRNADDDCMPDGIICNKRLALDVIGYIREINDFEHSQCAGLLAKNGELERENLTLKKALELALQTFCTVEELKPSIGYWTNNFIQQAQEQEANHE